MKTEARKLEMHTPEVGQLCVAIRSGFFLTEGEIDAILANRGFFQPYLRNALANRSTIARVPEDPIDRTDCQAIFLLTELEDAGIIHDLIKCLGMSEGDLRILYGDSLTEHMWLPFAKVGHDHLEELWEFVTDETADEYARHAAVAGVVAMHHFHPDRRAEAVAFVERLLNRADIFPIDHLAGILCDCADSGFTELADQAEEFASRMDDGETAYPMATPDDVRKAFRDGAQKDFISGRPHDVYGVNRQWERWVKSREQEKIGDDDRAEIILRPTGTESSTKKVGRNGPCPCGSGKKFKKCHGM